MGIRLTWILARRPLTKRFKADGSVEPYPLAKRVVSEETVVEGVQGFADDLKRYGERGAALLRGHLTSQLTWESRAGKTDRRAKTEWLLFDIDGLADIESPEDFLFDVLGLPPCGFVTQYSASYKVGSPLLRAHIFVPLDRPVAHEVLKRYTRWLNLTVPVLVDQLQLSVDGRTFKWPLDISVCDPSKLIYIAPPVFEAQTDPVGADRIQVTSGDPLSVTALVVPSADEVLRRQSEELRTAQQAAGATRVVPRTSLRRAFGTTWELVENPQACEVTDTREDREFVRLNINGGDSWAYWHPKGNARFIYSFKGGLVYPAKRFVPAYYRQFMDERREERAGEEEEVRRMRQEAYEDERSQPLIFTDADTENYYYGFVSAQTHMDDLKCAAKIATVRAWAQQNGVEWEGNPPVWEIVFDPDLPSFDFENNRANAFVPRVTGSTPLDRPPEPVWRLMRHVLGGDEHHAETLLHWLAYIWQTSSATGTAWIFHGTTGTGKDMLTGFLRRTLGLSHTVLVPPHLLMEAYNGWALRKVLGVVNEADSDTIDYRKAMPKLKDMITAERLRIRVMRKDSFETVNRMNFIFCSNRPNSVYMEPNDRRFHVPPMQQTPLARVMDTAELAQTLSSDETVLHDFRAFLEHFSVDEDRIRRPVDSPAKMQLKVATMRAAELLAISINAGDMASIVSLLRPAVELDALSTKLFAHEPNAPPAAVMAQLMMRMLTGTVLTYNDLRVLFGSMVDDRVPTSPLKLRQYLLHVGLRMPERFSPHYCKYLRKTMRGMPFTPKVVELGLEEELEALGYPTKLDNVVKMFR